MSPDRLAPVVLFVYARPEHTRRTLEALAANPLAEQRDLIVYGYANAARASMWCFWGQCYNLIFIEEMI